MKVEMDCTRTCIVLSLPREYYHCHKSLTVKEKSTWFHMERDDIKELPMGP